MTANAKHGTQQFTREVTFEDLEVMAQFTAYALQSRGIEVPGLLTDNETTTDAREATNWVGVFTLNDITFVNGGNSAHSGVTVPEHYPTPAGNGMHLEYNYNGERIIIDSRKYGLFTFFQDAFKQEHANDQLRESAFLACAIKAAESITKWMKFNERPASDFAKKVSVFNTKDGSIYINWPRSNFVPGYLRSIFAREFGLAWDSELKAHKVLSGTTSDIQTFFERQQGCISGAAASRVNEPQLKAVGIFKRRAERTAAKTPSATAQDMTPVPLAASTNAASKQASATAQGMTPVPLAASTNAASKQASATAQGMTPVPLAASTNKRAATETVAEMVNQ